VSSEHNPRGVDIPAFIAAIKTSSFSQEQLNTWTERLGQTFDAQRYALFGTLHGIYCDPASGEEARQNALKVFAPFKAALSPNVQSDLIDRHQEYKAKGDEKRSNASLQFFENLGLLSLLGDAELHAIFTTASQNLLAVHNAMNNFYNEPPFARRLAEIMSGSAVPSSAQHAVVEAIQSALLAIRMGFQTRQYRPTSERSGPFRQTKLRSILSRRRKVTNHSTPALQANSSSIRTGNFPERPETKADRAHHYFAEVEHAALSPANVVPGISHSRLFRNDEAAMQGVPVQIVERQIAHCYKASPEHDLSSHVRSQRCLTGLQPSSSRSSSASSR
jgi:hypothetical protein